MSNNFLNTKIISCFFLPDDYSLDTLTLKQQQTQDPVLKTMYSRITQNTKPDSLTPQIIGTPFLRGYSKICSQLTTR